MDKETNRRAPRRGYTFETVFPEPFVREWKRIKDKLEQEIMSKKAPEIIPSDEEIRAEIMISRLLVKRTEYEEE